MSLHRHIAEQKSFSGFGLKEKINPVVVTDVREIKHAEPHVHSLHPGSSYNWVVPSGATIVSVGTGPLINMKNHTDKVNLVSSHIWYNLFIGHSIIHGGNTWHVSRSGLHAAEASNVSCNTTVTLLDSVKSSVAQVVSVGPDFSFKITRNSPPWSH